MISLQADVVIPRTVAGPAYVRRPIDPTSVPRPTVVIENQDIDKKQFHILVSDDGDPYVGESLGNWLIRAGYTVTVHNVHANAFREFCTAQIPFSLVVTNSSGVDLIDKVKKQFPTTKVILCTASDSIEKGLADSIVYKCGGNLKYSLLGQVAKLLKIDVLEIELAETEN